MKRAWSRRNLWEKTPRSVKRAAGALLGRMPVAWLLGRRFRRCRRFAQEAQFWSAEQAREYQVVQLRRVCRIAQEGSAFYRRMFQAAGFEPGDVKAAEDLRGLPTIDRRTIREQGQEMCTCPVTAGHVDYVATGGTGGAPLQFYTNRGRSAVEYAYLVASWARAGYRLGMPLAVIRGRMIRRARNGSYYEYDPILRCHYYSNFHMTDTDVLRYLDHMAGIGPCFLHTYPTAASAVVRCLERAGRPAPANIRGIILESENVYPEARDALERVLGARCFACYGHSEKLVLAVECEKGHDYHVWPTYGCFELLDERGERVCTPGQTGEIVGTGFINTVMPFIRYRTGDYATYGGDGCPACGRQHVILRSIEGRWPAGSLIANDGSAITMTALNLHDDAFCRVERFRFYQDTPGRAVLRVMPAAGFGDADVGRIRQGLGRKLDGRVALEIETVDEIPLTARGKSPYVEQRIDAASLSRE